MSRYTFEHVDVKDALTQALKKELPKFGLSKIKVIKADPQTASEIPCIGINRIDDGESNQSIADVAGKHFDEATKTQYTTLGTYFQESLEIRVWHTNADERDKVYRHVKAILVALRKELVGKNLLNITIRGGKDEQDSSMQQAPMVLYWASLYLNFLNPLDVTFEEQVDIITAINPNMTGGTP